MEKIWLEFYWDIQFLEGFRKSKVYYFDWFSNSSPVGCSGNYPQWWGFFCFFFVLEGQFEAYMKLNSHIRIFGGKIQEKYLSISVYCRMIIFIVSRELGSEFKTLTGSLVTMNYCQKVERPGRGDVIWNRVTEYKAPSGALGWICQTPPWLPQSYFRSSSYGYSLSIFSVLRQGEYFTTYILVIKKWAIRKSEAELSEGNTFPLVLSLRKDFLSISQEGR